MPGILPILIPVVVAIVLILILVFAFVKTAKGNEALVISGLGATDKNGKSSGPAAVSFGHSSSGMTVSTAAFARLMSAEM